MRAHLDRCGRAQAASAPSLELTRVAYKLHVLFPTERECVAKLRLSRQAVTELSH